MCLAYFTVRSLPQASLPLLSSPSELPNGKGVVESPNEKGVVASDASSLNACARNVKINMWRYTT